MYRPTQLNRPMIVVTLLWACAIGPLWVNEVASAGNVDLLKLEQSLKPYLIEPRRQFWNAMMDDPGAKAPALKFSKFDRDLVARLKRSSDPAIAATVKATELHLADAHLKKYENAENLIRYLDRFEYRDGGACRMNYAELQEAATQVFTQQIDYSRKAGTRDCLVRASHHLLVGLQSTEHSLKRFIFDQTAEASEKLLGESTLEGIAHIQRSLPRPEMNLVTRQNLARLWQAQVNPSPKLLLQRAKSLFKKFDFNTDKVFPPEKLRDDAEYGGIVVVLNQPMDARWAMNGWGWNRIDKWRLINHELGHLIHAQSIEQSRLIHQNLPRRPITEAVGIVFGALSLRPEILKKFLFADPSTVDEFESRGLLFEFSEIFKILDGHTFKAHVSQAVFSHPQKNVIDNTLVGAIRFDPSLSHRQDWDGFSLRDLAMLYFIRELRAILIDPMSEHDYLRAAIWSANYFNQLSSGKSGDVLDSAKFKSIGQTMKTVFKLGAKIETAEFLSMIGVPSSNEALLSGLESYLNHEIAKIKGRQR